MFRRISIHHLVALLFYILAAAYLIAPVLDSLTTHFVGGNTSDVYEMARHVWWYTHALHEGENVFFQSLLAYPDGFAAVLLWANPLQFFPMWLFALFMPLALAYNLGILVALTLNGWSMYLFARRRISRNRLAPALIAGLIYMVFPVFQGHLFAGHVGLLAQWPVPLLLYFLFSYVQHGGKLRFLATLLLTFMAALGHSLQAVYLLAPLMGLFFVARMMRRDYVGAARLSLVAVTGAFALALFLMPVLPSTLETSSYREAGGHVRYSIDLLGIVSPSFENAFWRDIAPHSAQVLGVNLGEGASYVGIFGTLLALIGLLFRRQCRWWLLVLATAWLLALGPVLKVYDQALTLSVAGYSTVIPLPFAFLMNLPLVDLARTPGRFMFLFAAAFAVMSGYGMSVLCSRPIFRRRKQTVRLGLALILAFLIFHDYQLFERFPVVPATIPDKIYELRDRMDVRAVLNVPFDNLLAAKEAMYLQTAHGKPLIAGHDTRATPVDPARLTLLSTFQPTLLAEAGADIVILNKARAAEDGQFETLYRQALGNLGVPYYEDQRFAIFEVRPTRFSVGLDWIFSTVSDEQSHAVYIYKEEPGWLEFRATLRADDRQVRLSMNGAPLQKLRIVGEASVSIPLPIARRGYNTFRIELDPPCPELIDTRILLCHGVTLEDVELEVLTQGAIYDPIRIADGIELSGYYMPEDFVTEPIIHFWWSFDAPRSTNDVRFVHVLDENRGLGDQSDDTIGFAAAGSDFLESVRFDNVSSLPIGTYMVLTGWYELPEMVRYDVLTNVEGAQNSTILLGSFEVVE